MQRGSEHHRSSDAGRVRVLIIDPNPEERWNLVYLIQRQRVRAAAAACGDVALRYLSGQKVDLILSSLVLPGAAGLEILRTIRLRWPSMKVVLMAEQRSPMLLKLASKCGALDLIRHPVQEREVAGVLRWLS